jgi:hypothetical protein
METQTERETSSADVTDLKRRVDALEEAVRQLTEEVRRLYESADLG